MGCNCKKKDQVLNNIKNPVYLEPAKDVFSDIISAKNIEDYDELEKMVVMQTYVSLYPNNKSVPTLQTAVDGIRDAINLYNIKYVRKK